LIVEFSPRFIQVRPSFGISEDLLAKGTTMVLEDTGNLVKTIQYRDKLSSYFT
jgi:hypothetical protein